MSDRIERPRGSVTRFLGDTPLRTIVKLAAMSILVGMLMQFFGWTPRDVFLAVEDAVRDLWNTGFDALDNAIGYLLLGAAVVVPVFLVARLMSLRR